MSEPSPPSGLIPAPEDRAALGLLAAVSLCLALWGIGWGLPSAERAARVLPAGALGPAFQARLESSWRAMYARQGPEPLLSPENWAAGFERLAEVGPGWESPPDQLLNSARSFFLRSGGDDESTVLVALSRVRPHRLEFNPRHYTYGGLYYYLLGAWAVAAAALSPVVLTGSLSYYLAHPDKMAWLFLAARSFSVAHFVFATLALYGIGRRLFDRETGFWAGLFLAVSPGIVVQAHIAKPHLLGVVFIMGVFYFCARILQGGGRTSWLAAGAMAGAAAGTAPYFATSCGLVALTFVLRLLDRGGAALPEFRDAVTAALAAAAVFFLTNPFLLYDARTAWPALKAVGLGASARNPAHLWIFPVDGFVKAVGLPAALLVLFGLADRRTLAEPARRWAACAFVYYMSMTWVMQSADSMMSARNFPAFFAGFLLAGACVARWARASGGRWSGLARGVACAAAVYGALLSFVVGQNLHLDASRRSNQWLAGEWIEKNVRAGEELGFQRLPQPSTSPYFQWARYRLKFVEKGRLGELSREELPRRLVLVSAVSDEPKDLRAFLEGRYVLTRSFPQFGLPGLRLQVGEVFGNPQVDIYERSY